MAKISTLRDDFEDGVIDAVLWSTSGSVSETGGKLVITPASLGVSSFIVSNTGYDLTNSSLTLRIAAVTANGFSGTLESAFYTYVDSTNLIFFGKKGSLLQFGYVVANVESIIANTPYNSSSHAYWRIRADASNIYWETSSTGTGTFFIQATQNISAIFPVNTVGVLAYAEYNGAEPAPGSFQIASVNPAQQLAFSGASTSSGSLSLLQLHTLTFSGASTSSGSLDWTIPPASVYSMTFSGASTSSGFLSFFTLSPGDLAFAGSSSSNGSLAFTVVTALQFNGASFATGSLTLTVRDRVIDPDEPIQYYYFEPPVVYDRPGVHSRTPRRVRQYAYYDNHSLGATGVSVLKLDGVYQSIQTPTVDQIARAEYVYQGGHIYTIPWWEADGLANAGYPVTIIPLPVPTCPYPGNFLFPDEALYPCDANA